MKRRMVMSPVVPFWRKMIISLVALLVSAGAGAAPAPSERRIIQDIRYSSGPESDPVAHTLDLYLPQGGSNRPLLFFVHGGAWSGGDKSAEGLVNLLELVLSHGFAVASTNYRLSPAVQHPTHVQDVARAFAWVYRNASRYALDRSNFFIAGHSAGGHLVTLLATDPRFLRTEGLSLKDIRGVITSSGVYDMLNFRGPGINITIRKEAFGEEPETLKDASPVWKLDQVDPGTPPFLITYTDNDLFGFAEQARNFYRMLLDRRLPVHLVEIPARTHENVLRKIGRRTLVNDTNPGALVEVEDLLGPAIVWFLAGVQDGSLNRAFYAVWPPGGPEAVPGLKPPTMRTIKDLQYYDGPDSDPRFHSLDLYLPQGQSRVPVVFEVHGGRWREGDKGQPESLVNLMGKLGWGVVTTNYRVSPAVKHPTHVRDVARAFAWVYRNASRYGIDRDRMALIGHSAGGHLVALLGLDTRHLEAEGIPQQAIRAVVPTSGIYNLANWPEPGNVPTGLEQGFGTDAKTLADASPIHHLQTDAPPFLITFTDPDLYLLPEQAHEFYSALIQRGLRARLVRIPGRFHCCPTNYMTGLGQPPISLVDDILGVELVHFLMAAFEQR